MRILKLLAFLFLAMSLSLGSIAPAYAAKKPTELKKQKQEAKKKQKENAKKYKKNIKPFFDRKLSAARQERKQAKDSLRKGAKSLQKAEAELKPYAKANRNAKNALDKQKKALDSAIEKAQKNPSPKNIKDRDSRQARYTKAAQDYENGPKRNWQNKASARNKAKASYDTKRENYERKIADIANVVKNKILAKQKARAVVDVNPVSRASNAQRVFSRPVVEAFNADQKVKLNHPGKLIKQTDKHTGEDYYVPDASPKIGRFLGGGANSLTFEDSGDAKKVNKLVRITKADGSIDQSKAMSITDQMGGRNMLNKLNAIYQANGKDSLFSVAQAYGPPIVMEAKAPNGTKQKFAVSKEQNIASPVFDNNGQVIGMATNARERLQKRGQNKLNRMEELTINLVVRGLNQNGVAWTDHKLANLDVVKDPKSPTGHRVVFFDFDAFRPVAGADRKERYARARKVQKTFDNLDKGQMTRQLSNELVSKFDFTAFGGPNKVTSYMFTPGANKSRDDYHNLDSANAKQLNDIASTATQGKLKGYIDPL